jgi:hypothetical protein
VWCGPLLFATVFNDSEDGLLDVVHEPGGPETCVDIKPGGHTERTGKMQDYLVIGYRLNPVRAA